MPSSTDDCCMPSSNAIEEAKSIFSKLYLPINVELIYTELSFE